MIFVTTAGRFVSLYCSSDTAQLTALDGVIDIMTVRRSGGGWRGQKTVIPPQADSSDGWWQQLL